MSATIFARHMMREVPVEGWNEIPEGDNSWVSEVVDYLTGVTTVAPTAGTRLTHTNRSHDMPSGVQSGTAVQDVNAVITGDTVFDG